jgi:hypothetical protein
MNRRYVTLEIAPSGAPGDAGASGGGSPPPAANPNPPPQPSAPRVPFSLEALEGGGGSPPARQPASGGDPGGSDPNGGNPIPHTRVREMIAAERQRAQQAVAERDAFYERQFRQLTERLPKKQDPMAVLRQIAPLLGIEVPEEQPTYLTREDFQRETQNMESRFGAAFQLRAEHDQAQAELSSFKAQNPDYFDDSGAFESLVADVWGANENRSFAEALKITKGILDSHYDRRTRAYADGKLRDGQHAPVRGAAPAPRGTSRVQHDLATQDGQDSALDALLDQELGGR